MSSVIIWVLIMMPYNAFCGVNTRITFETEQECMTALKGIVDVNSFKAECVPWKKK